ncbi:MAG TPA: EF-P lysine aminoacylase EpmA [Steroidobacteraceae bacterium]|jgi:lysyl-tRNA synthetase class 2
MNWKPTATRDALEARARLLTRARRFFAERGILEVETPVLSSAAVSDPQLESLSTRIKGLRQNFYLQTSPEYAMKRLLASGSGDIFQICKVFRDGERGTWHNPEFTMLEWYRVGFDERALMREIEELLQTLLPGTYAAERLSYADAMQFYAGVDPFVASADELKAAVEKNEINYHGQLERDALLDLLMGFVVGPKLGLERPTFICDYPASQAALARLKPGSPEVAARFELYLGGVELANGFHELGDAREQRARFDQDVRTRARRAQARAPIDENLLAALGSGLPDCAGVALGVDRLIAVAFKATRLSQVMSFTIDNA